MSHLTSVSLDPIRAWSMFALFYVNINVGILQKCPVHILFMNLFSTIFQVREKNQIMSLV